MRRVVILGRGGSGESTLAVPPEFAPAVTGTKLSDADRSFLVVMSRVLGPQGLEAYADMLRHVPTDPALGEFDDLPADAHAGTETRRALAERFVPFVRTLFTAHPRLQDMSADAPGGARFANRTAATALRELYNPAQLDVLDRARRLLRTPPGRERPGFHLRALPPEPLGSGSYCRWTDSGSDLSATTISVARAVPRANESSQLCAAWPRRGE